MEIWGRKYTASGWVAARRNYVGRLLRGLFFSSAVSVCVLNVATFRYAPSWLNSANNRKKVENKKWGAAEGNSYNTVSEWLGTNGKSLYVTRLSYSESTVFRFRPKFLCSFKNWNQTTTGSQNSLVGIATRWIVRVRSPVEESELSSPKPIQIYPEARPTSFNGYRGPDVALTTHLSLAPRLGQRDYASTPHRCLHGMLY